MTKAKCIGVELDKSRWKYSNNLLMKLRAEAESNVILEEVFGRISFIEADILGTDYLKTGTHFYSFNWLFPGTLNIKIASRLSASSNFKMLAWAPKKKVTLTGTT
jgi:hypothetical protein